MPEALSLAEFRFLDEFHRYGAFLRLYSSGDPRDRIMLKSMYLSADPLVPLILLQYLEDIPEKKAIVPIIMLIEKGNLAVSRAAMAAYRKNHYPGKPRLLKPLILSHNVTACRFAVRTLSRAGFPDALPLILRELPEREDPVLSEMIIALRFLPDRRSLTALLPFASSKDEPIRYLALQTLASLQMHDPALPASFFLDKAKDESLRIRRVALEALQRRSAPAFTGILIESALRREEDEASRERAIRALAAFPSTDVVAPLVSILCGDDPASLKLAAEVVLKNLPPRIQKGGLVRLLDAARPDYRRWAAVLLAQFLGGDPAVRKILFDLWKEADDEAAVDLTEMLRELGGADAQGMLISAMRRNNLVAYAAAGALARIMGAGSGPRILAMLQDPLTSAMARQALLAHWAKRSPDEAMKPALLPWLLETLHHDVLNMRYLALQTLAWYPLEGKVRGLLDLLCREASPDVVRAVYRQFLRGLGRDPTPLVRALAEHPEHPRLMGHMVRVLTSQAWSPEVSLPLLELLMEPPLGLLDENPEAFFAVCAHLMESRGILLQTIWTMLGSDQMRRRFLEIVLSFRGNPKRRFPALPVAFLHAELASGPAEHRRLYYRLLESDATVDAAEALTVSLVGEDDASCRRVGADALRRVVAGAPA
ncbi:MAG: HEAT repeat domain-containing protein [Elusimicrobia bacterium]|nr:HEAT repeat domain-containing protein [Elusimicrobiota bacterium]